MRKLSQTPAAIAARKRKAAREVTEHRAHIERHNAHLAAHMVVRADGSEVMPDDILRIDGANVITFVRLTRAPGDGTGTNGKIVVNDPAWISPERELYPSVFGLSVVRHPGASSPYDYDDTSPIYTGEVVTNERGERGHWSLAGTWVPEGITR